MLKWITIILAGLLCVALGAAAVWFFAPDTKSSSDDNSSSNSTSGTSPTPTIVPSVSPTPVTITGKECASEDLSATIADDPNGAAAGSRYYVLSLTNKSQKTCTVIGYPGVSLINASGAQVGQPAERVVGGVDIKLHTLAPAQKAASSIRVVVNNFNPGVCADGATQLRIYPPDQASFMLIPTSITTWCPGFSVGPMTAL